MHRFLVPADLTVPASPSRLAVALAAVGITAALSGSANAAGPLITVRGDTNVRLVTEKVQWRVDGPFAQRDVWIQLRNPGNRPVEATLVLPLAEGEQLQGFALDIDGQLRDAVPVERVKAKAAFEDVVRAGVDPALVEKDEGPQYRVRVFPVPAQGSRKVRVTIASLAQRAACGWQHQLATPFDASVPALWLSPVRPVSGLPGWQPDKRAEGYAAATVLPQGAKPLSVCMPGTAGALHMSQSMPGGQSLHFVDVPAPKDTLPVRAVRAVEVVWDSSLNLGVDRSAELAFLEAYLLDALRHGPVKVQLSVLNLALQRQLLNVSTPQDVQRLLQQLAQIPSDGASTLASWRAVEGVDEVLLFSPLKETWPTERAAPSAVPVHVVSSQAVDAAKAAQWLKSGGVQVRLGGLDTAQALRQLASRPAATLRLGPTSQGWKAARLSPDNGSFRACHIGQQAQAPGELPIWRQGRPGTLPLPAPTVASQLAFWCGTWAMMDAQSRDATGEMTQIGQRFGVTGPETSLLVLERPEDYVRHGIDPGPDAPDSLRDAVANQQQVIARRKAEQQAGNRKMIESLWRSRQAWWDKDFPKDAPKPQPRPKAAMVEEAGMAQHPAPVAAAAREMRLERVEIGSAQRRADVAMPPPAPPVPVAAMAPPAPVMSVPPAPMSAPAAPALQGLLKTVRMNEPYTGELLSTRDGREVYQRYLSLRDQYAQSPAFYFDVAERLAELGQDAKAQLVLSNVVHLMPSEPDALRVVAYRLQQSGQEAAALTLLKKVAQLAPHEPQSFRDYGLALGKLGQCQLAGEQLAHTVETPWDSRFSEIGVTALAELNDLAQRCPGAWPETLPASLRADLPVGLRVTLRWNLNDTDIDLHVTDPLGETVYFGNRLSRQGGAMSRDFTAGYGPEEFVLKQPKPGRYKVSVNYFGSRKATLVRGAIVQVDLQSAFGTSRMKQQTLTLRLLEQSGQVMVGEFDVDASGRIVPVAH